MSRASIAVCTVLLVMLAAVSVHAQTGPPSPAPELKKVELMAGDWTTEGTVNPGPGMPGGKFSSSAHAEWMEGNFFLVEHSDVDMPGMGKMKELSVLGYDSDRKVYTYSAYNSMGQAEQSTGTVDGDTWTWLSDEHFDGVTMKGRFTMKVLSPTAYNMKFELSQDGKEWMTAMEGKATKK
jgi:hypothetical protein